MTKHWKGFSFLIGMHSRCRPCWPSISNWMCITRCTMCGCRKTWQVLVHDWFYSINQFEILFRFSRHNVLHLWPYVITDLKNLGAKVFYGKFATGMIEHISMSKKKRKMFFWNISFLCVSSRHSSITMYSIENCSRTWRRNLSECNIFECHWAEHTSTRFDW